MSSALYVLDTGFEAIRSKLLAGVDPRRAKVLHILVYNRATRADGLDVVTIICEYATFLGLRSDEVPYFNRVRRDEAERVCTNVAEFGLVMGDPQMPHETAAQLAAAWIGQFEESAVFLVNGEAATAMPPGANFGPSLFFTDLEAGAIAVSPDKAGLFWSAENS